MKSKLERIMDVAKLTNEEIEKLVNNNSMESLALMLIMSDLMERIKMIPRKYQPEFLRIIANSLELTYAISKEKE